MAFLRALLEITCLPIVYSVCENVTTKISCCMRSKTYSFVKFKLVLEKSFIYFDEQKNTDYVNFIFSI